MSTRRIVVTGGSGFVGQALCAQLLAQDPHLQLIVPTRQAVPSRATAPLPGINRVPADVHDPAQLAPLLAGADALIHLVAILHGDVHAFQRVHVALPRTLAAACCAAGVKRVLHVSALGVAEDAPSLYLRSKAAGEAVWQRSGLDVTRLRPSVIFGAADRFTNLFVKLQRALPLLPLAGADSLYQPVWVDDVAAALVACLRRTAGAGEIFQCAGPEVLSLQQIVQRVGAMAGCARPVLPVPELVARAQATLMALLPGEPLLTADNLLSMRVPNVARADLPGLAALGITPAPLEIMAAHFARQAA